MTIQSLTPDEVYKALQTGPDGLEGQEASARLKAFGNNEIQESARPSNLRSLLKHLSNLIALLLWAASIMALLARY